MAHPGDEFLAAMKNLPKHGGGKSSQTQQLAERQALDDRIIHLRQLGRRATGNQRFDLFDVCGKPSEMPIPLSNGGSVTFAMLLDGKDHIHKKLFVMWHPELRAEALQPGETGRSLPRWLSFTRKINAARDKMQADASACGRLTATYGPHQSRGFRWPDDDPRFAEDRQRRTLEEAERAKYTFVNQKIALYVDLGIDGLQEELDADSLRHPREFCVEDFESWRSRLLTTHIVPDLRESDDDPDVDDDDHDIEDEIHRRLDEDRRRRGGSW
jgi:hypothetical protein